MAGTSPSAEGPHEAVELDGTHLTLEGLVRLAAGKARAAVPDHAREAVRRARSVVEAKLASGEVAYGINTGFGKLAEVRIPPEDLERLQLNLVRSHAVGVGPPLSQEEARALVALRANCLAKGFSGVRLETLEMLVALLNRGVTPVIPERGSVGASGDLAPLAHLALVLVGEGEAWAHGTRQPGAEALARAGLSPLRLTAKEGIALVNGTQAMCAVGALALHRALTLVRTADLAGALTVEGLKGSVRPFSEAIQQVRPHPGQKAVARNLRTLLEGSRILESHADCGKVQDAYSLRCMPQVHGACRDGLAYLHEVLVREMNSATDNPLVFPESGDIVSGGNFHGQPVALALDVAALEVLGYLGYGGVDVEAPAEEVHPALHYEGYGQDGRDEQGEHGEVVEEGPGGDDPIEYGVEPEDVQHGSNTSLCFRFNYKGPFPQKQAHQWGKVFMYSSSWAARWALPSELKTSTACWRILTALAVWPSCT